MAAYKPESESQDKTIISNQTTTPNSDHQEDEEEVIVYEPKPRIRKPRKRVPHVCLEGYVEPSDDDDLPRTKSLTDDDLDELKGCVDLGFGFSYDEIPELCNTLPALELCYSMSQKFLDDHPNQQQYHQQSLNHANSTTDTASSSGSESSSPMPTWKISSPGDHPEDVKARLKFWAQAVACTVKLCS
ncbi:uncharacterized protein LOC110718218 [Chenopodium quinoa]|uniref:uncharacterized protein LOC110718218 n=1 Tax=Chenopodium quinoa TaxID=63459 RepID=UPI000B77DE6B|nr:uncharacterized protein LOC110718218 [Chenopodium quinoa]